MRKFSSIIAILLTATGAAEAQTVEPPKWDFNLSAGFFESKPFEGTDSFDDEWYGEGRYAASIGYYWTEHLKTEFEFAHTGDGRRWAREIVRVPGTSVSHPISTEVFHRLQQGSARAVWQFNENTWVHPYLNGGLVVDVERRTWQSPAQFYYPGDPRTRSPVLLRPEIARGSKVIDYRYGITLGGGSKFYVSPNTYLNTGMQVTYAKPATTISVLVGFGIDF